MARTRTLGAVALGMALGSALPPVAARAEILTSTVRATHPGNHLHDCDGIASNCCLLGMSGSGGLMFGYVPDPGSVIIEVATLPLTNVALAVGSTNTLTLPVPTFLDGTADPSRVLWTLNMDLGSGNDTAIGSTWSWDYAGGATLTCTAGTDVCFNNVPWHATVSAIAFKVDAPLPTHPTTWGKIKSTYGQ